MLKLIDAHAHITKLNPLGAVAARMDEAGVVSAVIMAREAKEDRILAFARRYPRKVWPMIGGRLFQRALQDGSRKSRPRGVRHFKGFEPSWWRANEERVFAALDRALAGGLYRGVGEIRLKHRGFGPSVPEMKCDYDFEPDSPVILRLLETCARRRVPVVFHLEVDVASASRLAAFSRALKAVPRARAVWAHAGPCEPGLLSDFLGRHPNLWAEIQPLTRNTYADRVPYLKTFPPLTGRDGSLLPAWKRVFEKRADRLMFGSDCRTALEYRHLLTRAEDMRALLAQLPGPAARAIAHRNAETLFARRTP